MESGDEDDAFTMGEREWQKMNRDLSKQGYRDGKNEGREKGRQKSFEQAISLSFKHALKLGQIIGLIEWKLTQSLDQEHKESLIGIRKQVLLKLENLKEQPESKNSDATEDNNLLTKDLQTFSEKILSHDVFADDSFFIKNI